MRRTDSLEIPWWWEWLKAEWEGDDREQDGWMASLAQWASEFEQHLRDGEGYGCLGCCSTVVTESDTTEWMYRAIYFSLITLT